MQVKKRVVFAAAHSIKGAGKCAQKHGHNWEATIDVDLVDGYLEEHGFIVDVQQLKQAAFKYDHDDLDNYFDVPSTENIASQIAQDALEVCKEVNPHSQFRVKVELIETENNSATAFASNLAGPGFGV